MSGEILSLVIDVVILILLGATIYYALQLSSSLKRFRAHRQEFQKLVAELNAHIEKAYQAIDSLKSVSSGVGGDTQKVLEESRSLVDELQIMNQVGNNLATRLENLAEKNRRLAEGLPAAQQGADSFGGEYGHEEHEAVQPKRSPAGRKQAEDTEFFIQDREFSDEEYDIFEQSHWESHEEPGLKSQAEKELYEALFGKKRAGRA